LKTVKCSYAVRKEWISLKVRKLFGCLNKSQNDGFVIIQCLLELLEIIRDGSIGCNITRIMNAQNREGIYKS